MKVYLSRSNAANPAVFSLVQQVIENLGHEIVTFNGEKYSKEPLLACDALVVVPSADMLPGIMPNRYKTVLTDNQPHVGKGQFEQCRDFALKHAEEYEKDELDLFHIQLGGNTAMMVVREVSTEDPNNPIVYVDNIHGVRI